MKVMIAGHPFGIRILESLPKDTMILVGSPGENIEIRNEAGELLRTIEMEKPSYAVIRNIGNK